MQEISLVYIMAQLPVDRRASSFSWGIDSHSSTGFDFAIMGM